MLQPSPSLSYTTLQPAGNKWAGKSSSEKCSRSLPKTYRNTSNLNSTLNLYFLILPTLRLLSILSFNLLMLSSTRSFDGLGFSKDLQENQHKRHYYLCIIHSYSGRSLVPIGICQKKIGGTRLQFITQVWWRCQMHIKLALTCVLDSSLCDVAFVNP